MKHFFYRIVNITVYRFGYFLFKILSKILFRPNVQGRKNIPPKGAFILAPNHASSLDPHIVGTSIWREIYFFARSSLMKNRPLQMLFRLWNCITVDRDNPTPGSLKKAVQALKQGKPLVIFPEGTRSENGELQKGKLGLGFIAHKSQVPIVPVYVHGSYEILPKGIKFPRFKKLTVSIGKPLDFETLYLMKGNGEVYQTISDQVMHAITELKNQIIQKKST